MCTEYRTHVSENDAPEPRNIAAGGLQPAGYDPRMDEMAKSAAADAIAKAPMREIPHALMLQDDANDRLSKAVEILHDRTSGLRNGHMERAQEDCGVRDFGSETARTIADQAYRTDLAAQVIEKILSEMEL